MARFNSNTWNFDDILELWDITKNYADNKYNLTYYDPQFEIVSYEQMISAYATIGLPEFYQHWSIGKKIIEIDRDYKAFDNPLAYEMVINSDPAITYLMENNNFAIQALVVPHASLGHTNMFKENTYFKRWTNPKLIVPYMQWVNSYVSELEKKEGESSVEAAFDLLHIFRNHAVDRFTNQTAVTKEQAEVQIDSIITSALGKDNRIREVTSNWEGIKARRDGDKNAILLKGLNKENILKTIIPYSMYAYDWTKDLMEIICVIEQYFYPQKQTKILHEGWASFWHYTILNDMYDDGYINEEILIEALRVHTNVLNRPKQRLNPYDLGFNMFQDIKRICIDPTSEDKKHFTFAGKKDKWLDVLKEAAYNYNDEYFIYDYLSPKLIREFKFFVVHDDSEEDHYIVSNTSSEEEDYKRIREVISKTFSYDNHNPNVVITEIDLDFRSITLRVDDLIGGRSLDQDSQRKLGKAIQRLTGCRAVFTDGRHDVVN